MEAPLDSTPEEFESLINATVPRLVEWMRTLPEQPAQASDQAAPHVEAFREPVPESGRGMEDLVSRVLGDAVPFAYNTASPGYLAYVPGGGLPSAAVADLMASITNRYAGVWAAAPVAVQMEVQVIRWLCALMGMPDGSLGAITTGGSLSNLIGAVTARHDRLGEDLRGARAYVSSEIHHCMTKALRLAGIPGEGIRVVPVNDRYQLDTDALRHMIKEDRERGHRPFLACASAGTVNTGAVDPLDTVADVCDEEELWFHVDGAYGALFRLVPELNPTLRGIERADSLVLDPHKGLFLPYGTGVILARDPAAMQRAHGDDAAYLPPKGAGEQVDFCNLTPELSRDWRGLRLWLPFMLHGVGAFRAALREKHGLATAAASAIGSAPDVELAHPPALSLFAFRQTSPGASVEEENRMNRDLLERINAPRRIMLTATEIDGVFWIRMCVLHLRTHQRQVDEAVEIVQRELAHGR